MGVSCSNLQRSWWLASLLALALLPGRGWSASAFLFLPGIPGDSTDANHPGWIDVQQFQFGVARTPQAGAPSLSDLLVLKGVDSASPLLALQCALGTALTNATLEFMTTFGTNSLLQYQVSLEEVWLSGVNPTVTNNLAESAALRFRKITWRYVQYDAQGQNPVDYITSWDLGPLPLVLTVVGTQNPGTGTVTLRWPAVAGKNYDILGSAQVTGSYTLVRTVRATNTGPMTVTVPAVGNMLFFRLRQGP